MAVFRFGLQRILEMRSDAVSVCERQMEQILRIRDELRRLQREELNHYWQEREALNGLVAQGEIQKMSIYEGSLELRKQRILTILGHLRDVESDVDLIQQNLTNARRDLKVVENLKKKRLMEFNRAEDLKERKSIEEQATLRYLRREGGESWGGNG